MEEQKEETKKEKQSEEIMFRECLKFDDGKKTFELYSSTQSIDGLANILLQLIQLLPEQNKTEIKIPVGVG